MVYEHGDIVVVPFPFVDNANAKSRPAVVLSSSSFNEENNHTILAMITTASSITWKSDIEIQDLQDAGLPTKSFIRMKLFTLDNRLIKKKIGKLDPPTSRTLNNTLTTCFSIS